MELFTEQQASELYEWYSNLENRIRLILEIIPFTIPEELKKIVTPRLVPILVESASIIDSVFRTLFPNKAERPNNKTITKKGADIYDYFRILEKDLQLSKTPSLVLMSPPFILAPFQNWSDSTPNPLKWWTAYNRLKHDRVKWSKEATLLNTLNALCGLQQLMTKMSDILRYSLRFKWVDLAGYNPSFLLESITSPNSSRFLAITNFFCTPLRPVLWNSVTDIRPFDFENPVRLYEFLGRIGEIE